MTVVSRISEELPGWVPEAARLYLRHTGEGRSLRELAREEGVHPSTILRRVRRLEARRDDPLVDEALSRLTEAPAVQAVPEPRAAKPADLPAEEVARVLRRMVQPNTVMAVAPDLDKAAVLKGTLRVAVLDRSLAQAIALKGWIVQRKGGRVAVYEISAAGRAELARLSAAPTAGFAEAQAPFAAAGWAESDNPRRLRYGLPESPIAALARRREKDGSPFLAQDLVAAAERLREDFEIAQMGPRVTQNWEGFLSGAVRGFSDDSPAEAPRRARDRVAAALRDLGPGLGDVVLRTCCYLEGLEVAEKRLGWAARSGKIVLRIALIRLRRHYDETYGGAAPLIG